jgi:DNA gyrase subunit A
VLCIKESGQVTRSSVDELRPTGRDTKGVKFVGVGNGDSVVQVARSVERAPELDDADAEEAEEGLSEAPTDNASAEGSDAGDGAGATIEAEGAGTPAADAADVDGETEES